MSATEQMRAMLDELMGTNRDGEGPKIRFDDPSVCKCFLLGCCPHEILQGTRMDIGECPNMHDVALKADYSQAPDRRRYCFEYDALDHLENFIAECDRRTDQAKKRLRETQEDLTEDASDKAELISKLGEEIGTKLANAEKLGAEGKVDESLQLMKEVDELSKRKADIEKEFRDCMPVSTYQQQKLRVCEICSAYLGIHDNDRRLADHFGGKLHLGFIQIRERLAELRATVKAMREQRRGGSGGGGTEDRWRQASGGERGSRSRSRSRRHRRSRSRSKSSSHSSRKRHHHRHKQAVDEPDDLGDVGGGGGSRRGGSSRRRSRSRSRSSRSSHRRHSRSSKSSSKRSHRDRDRERDRDRRSRSRSRSRRHKRSRSRSRSGGGDGAKAEQSSPPPATTSGGATNGSGGDSSAVGEKETKNAVPAAATAKQATADESAGDAGADGVE